MEFHRVYCYPLFSVLSDAIVRVVCGLHRLCQIFCPRGIILSKSDGSQGKSSSETFSETKPR